MSPRGFLGSDDDSYGYHGPRGGVPGPPGGQYLGVAPGLAYELFGRPAEEAARQRQMQQLQQLLQQMRPGTETVQEPILSQEPTGRYHVGEPIPPGPTGLSDALTGVTDYPIPGPGYQPPQVEDYPIPGPGYMGQSLEYDIPGPGYQGQRAQQPPTATGPQMWHGIVPSSLYGEPTQAYHTFPEAPQQAPRINWPDLPPEIVSPEGQRVAGAPFVTPEVPPTGQELPVTPPPAPSAPPQVVQEAPPLRREPIEARPVLLERGEEGRETEPVTRMREVTRDVPGKEFLDLLMQDPKTMLGLLKAFPGVLPLIQKEQERQETRRIYGGEAPAGAPAVAAPGALASATGAVPAAEAPAAAAPAEAVDPQVAAIRAARLRLEPKALRIYGTPDQGTKAGQEIITRYEKLLAAEDAAEKRALEGRKSAREEREAGLKETKAAQAAQMLDDEATRLEATGDPANLQLARTLRAAALDPKAAEFMQKHYEQQQKLEEKRTELDKPILIEGQPYRMERNAQGEPVMQPIPGVPQKAAKPWYEGITRAEAEAMANDPALPPERRAQARQLADTLQRGAEKVAKEGAPEIKVTPPQVTTGAQQMNMIRMTREIRQLVNDPDVQQKIGGPYGLNTKASVFLNKFKDDPKFSKLVKLGDRVKARVTHELTGAAVGGNDRDVYLSGIPDMKTMSLGEYVAALDVIEEETIALIEYANEIRRTGEINLPVADRSIPLPTPVWNTPGWKPGTAGAGAAPGAVGEVEPRPGSPEADEFARRNPGKKPPKPKGP